MRLTVVGQDRLQTLCEHVERPNETPSLKSRYECRNAGCSAFESVCWNEGGESYALYGHDKYQSFETSCIGNNTAPFGSFQRQMNVEIYKKDENHPLFGITTRWGYIEVAYHYKSDRDGNILSRRRSYNIWKKAEFGHTLYTSGARMLIYCLKSFYRKLHSASLGPDDIFNRRWRDNRWWKQLSMWHNRTVLRLFYPKVFKTLKAKA